MNESELEEGEVSMEIESDAETFAELGRSEACMPPHRTVPFFVH